MKLEKSRVFGKIKDEDLRRESVANVREENYTEELNVAVGNQLAMFETLVRGILSKFLEDVVLRDSSAIPVRNGYILPMAIYSGLKQLKDCSEDYVAIGVAKPSHTQTALDRYIYVLARAAYKAWLEEIIWED